MLDGATVSVIVTCAGRGTRFGGNKLLVTLGKRTVLEHTVRALSKSFVDQLIVTVNEENEETYREILHNAGLRPVFVRGGAERHISAQRALEVATGDIVVVHDGVRPFVTKRVTKAVIRAAMENGAAMAGTPSTVQVKLVGDSGFVEGSLDRQHSWLGQTPQAFRSELLRQTYAAAESSGYHRVSDDADMVAEFTGVKARILQGDPQNIKITTRQDMGTAKQILREIKAGRKR